MSTTQKVIVVSGDGHIGAEPETYREYLDPEYRDYLPQHLAEHEAFNATIGGTIQSRLTPEQLAAVDDEGAVAAGGEFGLWDPDVRMKELDREGVAGEILHAGPHCTVLPFFSVMNSPFPADVRVAGMRAYHRWAADVLAVGKGRLTGIADPGTSLDFDQTRAELTWCAARGFRGVSMPQQVWDDSLPPILDAYYEPFWQICDDLDLTLSIHAGWGSPQGKFQEFCAQFTDLVVGMSPEAQSKKMMEALGQADDSPLQLDMGPRRVLWQLMLGGVLDRHPNLRVALTEVRADWIPGTIAHLDHLAETTKAPMALKPSEYYARNVFTTPSSIHRCEVEMRYEIGVDQMLFGTDYPHPEGTWPNTRDWLGVAFGALPEHEVRAILGENAIRAYGLDRAVLEDAAARIGPDLADILGEHTVPEARLAHWNARAGFSRGPERPDLGMISTLFDEDRQAVSAH